MNMNNINIPPDRVTGMFKIMDIPVALSGHLKNVINRKSNNNFKIILIKKINNINIALLKNMMVRNLYLASVLV